MKKNTFLVLLLFLSISMSIGQECDLTNTSSFTGFYQVEQITPSIFGFETFTDGSGTTFTLVSEVTNDTQAEPGIVLADNQRAFDADYIPALFDNTRTYIMEFTDCGVTFAGEQDVIDGSDGGIISCDGVTPVFLGPTVGGDFNSNDDTEFTLIFQDDISDGCNQGSPIVELRFFKGATIFCQDDINITLDPGMCEAIVEFDPPVATDLDGTTIVAEQTSGSASGSAFQAGVTSNIIFSVTSAVTGEVTSCNFSILVLEDVSPTIICPPNVTLGTGGNSTAIVPDFITQAVVNDNCTSSEALGIIQDPPAGTVVDAGDTITITLTARDFSGNEASCDFNVLFDATLSLEDTALENALTMYPNPTQGVFTIRNAPLDPLVEVVISDINGRVIQTIDASKETSEIQVSLDIYASGIYFVRMNTATASVIKRVVKQ